MFFAMPATLAPDRTRAAVLFHALSDETRLGIVDMLRDGERCVCDLMEELDAAQSRLSFHLKVLRDAGLVHDRPAGRWTYYTLCTETLSEAQELLTEMRPRPARRRLPVKCC